MRYLTTVLLFILVFPALRAERLPDRLRMLIPGEGRSVVRERRLVEDRLEKLLFHLKHSDRLGQLPTGDQVELLRRRLGEELLREYRPGATLTDAVREGTYTDATAIILYALSLEHFNIPYDAFVDHWQAQLVVDPYTTRYRLRAPGATQNDEARGVSFRREYLALVRRTVDFELGRLTDAQADSVFYAHFYHPAERLTLRQLSAYQQLRRAQDAYANCDYATAKVYLDHARTLDNRPAISVLERAVNLQLTALSDLNGDRHTDRLFASWQADPDNPYYAGALLQSFDRHLQELLAGENTDAALRLAKVYAPRAPAQQSDWIARLELLRDVRLLEHYRGQGKVVPALEIAESLLAREPANPDFEVFVAELALYDIRRNYPEPERQLERAHALRAKYAFVTRFGTFADIVLRESALRVRDAFAEDRKTEARRELDYFRAELDRLPVSQERSLWTLTAFIAASNYYFAREDYDAALEVLDEALRYDPDSDFLLHERDLIERY